MRNWLLRVVAGDRQVLINVTLYGVRNLDVRKGLIYRCAFYG